MLIVRSRNGTPVRLTDERWLHIAKGHPEMTDQREKVLETVAEPDLIQGGDFGTLLGVRFYPNTPLTEKYLVVVYRDAAPDDGFIVTAFSQDGSPRRG